MANRVIKKERFTTAEKDKLNSIIQQLKNKETRNEAIASKTAIGNVKIGDNINISNGTISVPVATTSQYGVVKVGDGITVKNGQLNINAEWLTQFINNIVNPTE